VLGGACEVFISDMPAMKVGAGGTAIVLLFLALVGVVWEARYVPAADAVLRRLRPAAVVAGDDRCGCQLTAAAIAQILPPLRRHRRPIPTQEHT
jgi:hypothetical protein